ncbi:MAG: GNAT family N-acetyltransferase [Chitinophagales bacterium]|nr:GNAT family N-acetyltransferase [Chitinophagales bacterium]
MKVEIKRYTEDLRGDWDGLVAASINGTFLHTRSFFDHNPQNAKDDCSFIYYKNNKPVALIPAALYQRNENLIWHSHPRSTYGGFVVNTEVGTEEAMEMVELLINECRELKVQEVIVRNPFRIFNKALCDETDFAMWYYGFKLSAREVEIAVPLKGDITELRKKYENGTKYNVKKAVKTVVSSISEDYETFWQILETNLMEKHGKKPVHNYEQFLELKRKVGDDCIKLFAGFIDGKMVCGVLVFVFSKDIHAQYIGADSNHQAIRPVNAVIDYIIEWANGQGYEYFNLGTGSSEGGRNVNLGLFHFKEGFGGRGVLRETMSLTL